MAGPAPTPERETRRIVVRGVNWLGDAVMTLPAVQRLRERFPAARLSILTHEKLGDLWKGHPGINEVLLFSADEGLWPIAQRLRHGHYDLALLLPNSPRAALEAWFAGIAQRVGYARPWRTWFLTRAVGNRPGHAPMRKRSRREIQRLVHGAGATGASAPGHSDAHHVHDYLWLMGALGADATPIAPRLEIPVEEAKAALKRCIPSAPSVDNVWVGMNATAAYGPAKCWPLERFAQVIQQLARDLPAISVLAFGARGDTDLNEEVARRSGVRVINLAGQTSLRELMCLLRLCRVVLTNDSGPMHLAAALGTPVVVPFGSTSPELTGPGMPGQLLDGVLKSQAPCSPCFRRSCPIDLRCMKSIGVEQVVAAMRRALGKGC